MQIKNLNKGMAHSTWIVITLVVVLIIALILITISGGSLRKGGSQSDKSITDSGSGLNAQVCTSLCESCKKASPGYPESPTCDNWATYGGTCDDGDPPVLETCS